MLLLSIVNDLIGDADEVTWVLLSYLLTVIFMD